MDFIKEFFCNDTSWVFEPYELEHTVVCGILLAFIVIIVGGRNRINFQLDRKIRVISTGIMFLFEILFHVWNYVNNENFVGALFYFDLCSATLVLATLFNMTPNEDSKGRRWLFELIYFWAIGACAAFIFPNIAYGANKFRFYHFFIVHGYIILTAIYGLAIEKRQLTLGSFGRAFGALTAFGCLVLLVNRVTGQNYMFLSQTPEIASPLDILGEGMEYFSNLFLLCGVVLFLLYLPHYVYNHVTRGKVIDGLEEEIAIAIAEDSYVE